MCPEPDTFAKMSEMQERLERRVKELSTWEYKLSISRLFSRSFLSNVEKEEYKLCVMYTKNRICHLIFVPDRITGTGFLINSDTQISLILVAKAESERPCKFTLQAFNKSLIQTYGQNCFSFIV